MTASARPSLARLQCRLRAGLAAFGTATLLAACGGASSPEPNPPAANSVGSAGGSVSTSDNKATVRVAAGALRGDTVFDIIALSSASNLPGDYVALAGTAYQIAWHGAGFTDGSGVTLSLADPGASPAKAALVHALGMRPLANTTPPTSAVVTCADGSSHVFAITLGLGYGDASVILCDPVTAPNGTTLSNSTVVLAQPAPGRFPTISAQPASVSTTTGSTATFSVAATAATALSYQWLRDGNQIAGATGPSYGLLAGLSDSGAAFSVRVSNSYGSLTSSVATLTVGPPPPPPTPMWSPPTDLSGYTTASDLPQVSAFAGMPVLAWNANGVLGSDDATLSARQLPMRGRPKLLTGPNFTLGYIVFIDDDGSGQCSTGWGNRLSAVAVGMSSESGPYNPSDRFTVYQASGDCITGFSAAMGLDAAQRAAIVYALQQQTDTQMMVGTAAATHSSATVVNGKPIVTWTPSASGASPLTSAAVCAHAYLQSSDAMAGTLQGYQTTTSPISNTTLAWVAANGAAFNVCSATYANDTWSSGAVVMDNAQYAEPVVTMDGLGNTLIAASRVVALSATPLSFAMTTAFRPASGGAWQTKALDASDAAALPSAAFDATGNAFIVWRPSSVSGSSTVYQTRRSADGSWDPVQAISAPNAVETRYPRICVSGEANGGQAVALFEQNFTTGGAFHVNSRRWRNGVWSDIGVVQTNANEGRYADCPRNTGLANLPVIWRETSPADPTLFRVMTSSLLGN